MKPGWTRVAFGDVVRLNTERASDPEAAGFRRYVGLEHIDPGDLTIRRWGDVSDGTTFTNVFRPGQVLFGKRRAYQRKVAVPDFSGVCSSDIYVLESKDDRHLLPELLPFICQTDAFFEHAVGTSAGSLSPRTNWTSLVNYEFALPSLAEQRRILTVLRTGCDIQKRIHLVHVRSERVIDRFISDTFWNLTTTAEPCRAADFGNATMGRQKSPKYRKRQNPAARPYPYLRVANVGHLEARLEDVHEMDFTPGELERFCLLAGDILITEGDLISSSNVGRSIAFNGEIENCCFQNTLIRFRPHPDVPSLFALLLFEGARLSGIFAEAANTTTVTHLGLNRFRKIVFPLPDIDTREELSTQFKFLLDSRRRLDTRLRASRALTDTFLADTI